MTTSRSGARTISPSYNPDQLRAPLDAHDGHVVSASSLPYLALHAQPQLQSLFAFSLRHLRPDLDISMPGSLPWRGKPGQHCAKAHAPPLPARCEAGGSDEL